MFWRKKVEERIECQSWFSYSVMLPNIEEDEQEVMIIGNYIIKNTGTETLNKPIICIRITPPKDVRLGGKIGSITHTALMVDGSNSAAWEYIHNDWREKSLETGEHWLKPKVNAPLLSNESIAFAYELQFPLTQKEKYVNVEGFIYFDEINQGLASLNKMTINF
ncbi:hypothetical protein [Neobacillus niacini]|uniref:hypothetical protein n=1 Tax=Neobacillus niacini TaxID=86668 RepID=UPI0028573672|nr:hypothetical protein [Neobacillus niacini]MDR7001027.1 hypothetical protein [Neobacillus niacini]